VDLFGESDRVVEDDALGGAGLVVDVDLDEWPCLRLLMV